MATAKIEKCFTGFPAGEFKKVEKAVAQIAGERPAVNQDYVRAVQGLLEANERTLAKLQADLNGLTGKPVTDTQPPQTGGTPDEGPGTTRATEAAPQPAQTFEQANEAVYKQQLKVNRLKSRANKIENETQAGDPKLVKARADLREAEAESSRLTQIAADLAPAPKKETVETKVKEKAKAAKAQKEIDSKLGKQKVTPEQAADEWEEYGFGTEGFTAYANLDQLAKENWRLAVEDGYANVATYDEISALFRRRQRAEAIQAKVEENKPDLSNLFRVANTGKGMTAEQVGRIYDDMVSRWKNVPAVQVVQSERELPASIYSEIVANEIQGKVPGIYSQATGRVFLVADNLSGVTDTMLTVAHEITGHFGLRAMLGDRYTETMLSIYKGNAGVRAKADAMMARENLKVDVAVEEVLADMAEESLKLSLEGKPIPDGNVTALQKIFAAIRKWLRENLGIKVVTDRDLRDIVANARRFVVKGDVTAANVSAKVDADGKVVALRQTGVPTFFSALERGFRSFKRDSMPADQWKSWLASNKGQLGIKDEEIEWTGINDFLDLKGKDKLTKDEVLNFIGTNRIRLNDVILKEGSVSDEELRELVESAGENPYGMTRDDMADFVASEYGWPRSRIGTARHKQYTLPGAKEYVELILTEPSAKTKPYKSSDTIHFGDVAGGKHIGWLRMNVRQDVNGNDVLFLEELQSQRAQDGRKSGFRSEADTRKVDELKQRLADMSSEVSRYNERMRDLTDDQMDEFVKLRDERAMLDARVNEIVEQIRAIEERSPVNGVPDAPFVRDTKAWTSLLIKRAIAYAQENGIDRIAWTAGDQQSARYDLSKQVESVMVSRDDDGKYLVSATLKDGPQKTENNLDASGVESMIGKELAQKLIAGADARYQNSIARQAALESGDQAEYDRLREERKSLPQDRATGLDLKVGGEGMREFYDKLVPQVANSVIKKFGGKVEVMEFVGTEDIESYGLPPSSEFEANRLEGETMFDYISRRTLERRTSKTQQLGFVIPAKLQEVMATDGLPLFRRKDFEAQFDDLDPAVREMALDKVAPKPPTARERIEAMKPMLQQRIVQGAFDKFRRIRDVSERAWKMARVSAGPQDGGVSTMLYYGQVYNDDGALNYREGTRGLRDIMQPLGQEVDRFLMWIAANRAERLAKEDRERYFKPGEIAALKKLNVGSMKDGTARAAVYAKVLNDMNELNRSALEVAKSTGILDDAAYKRFAADIWYVPFYRQMQEDGTVAGPSMSTSLTGQEFSKMLKGSSRPLNDLMENVLKNWSHILSASMKNQAANETLRAAEQMGLVERVEPVDAERGKLKNGDVVRLKGSVKAMEGGKEVRYFVKDELLLDSLSKVTTFQGSNLFLDVAGAFKTTFTRFISLSPTYKINQLIRDSVQSIGVSELGYNPFANIKTGITDYYKNRASAMAGGGIFTLGNAFDGDQNANFKRLVASGVDPDTVLTTPEKTAAFLKRVWDKYDEASDAMENANRLALHRKLRATGASQLDAVFAARDLQDFSLQGSWEGVRYLARVVPYFNARLQGLYKLGRDGFDPVISTLSGKANESQRQKAAKFATMTFAVTAAALLLYLGQKDDEDWKKREDWDRDNFFWFKVPGTDTIIRIPKPFEMGAIATLFERLTEQMADDSVEGKVFFKRLGAVLADNLSLNPLPSEWQVFKPLYELTTNKDGFTGRDIESMGMERLSKVNRTNAGTSAAAEALGNINWFMAELASDVTGGAVDPNSASLSPIQYDYLLRGYLGWMGTVIQTVSHGVTAPFTPGESSKYERVDDLFVVGNFVKTAGAQASSKYVTDFYASAKAAALAAADVQYLLNNGQVEKATELMNEKSDIVSLSKLYSKATAMMSEINKQIKAIEKDETMDGETKRAEMDRLRQFRVEYAKQVEELRKQMKKVSQ